MSVHTGVLTLIEREIKRHVRGPRKTVVVPFISKELYFAVFGVIFGSRIGEVVALCFILFTNSTRWGTGLAARRIAPHRDHAQLPGAVPEPSSRNTGQ